MRALIPSYALEARSGSVAGLEAPNTMRRLDRSIDGSVKLQTKNFPVTRALCGTGKPTRSQRPVAARQRGRTNPYRSTPMLGVIEGEIQQDAN